MALISNDIQIAIKQLNADKVIGLPTETVYGLAGNALKSNVAARIFEIKNRPSFDPLIVHLSSVDEVEKYTQNAEIDLMKLFKSFSPGPITILLPKKNIIPDIITSGLERVALRIPNHPLALELLQKISFPLAAPSANPFGYVSPTSAQHVENQLGKKIEYILDGGQCTVGVESTIVGFENEKPIVYRLGGLEIEKIEKEIGKVEIRQSSSKPSAPGMLINHYAPKKKVIIGNIDQLLVESKSKKIGIISYYKNYKLNNELHLSKNQNLTEAAQNIFSYLRILDNSDVDFIITELLPEVGLGRAINDRLRRAGA